MMLALGALLVKSFSSDALRLGLLLVKTPF